MEANFFELTTVVHDEEAKRVLIDLEARKMVSIRTQQELDLYMVLRDDVTVVIPQFGSIILIDEENTWPYAYWWGAEEADEPRGPWSDWSYNRPEVPVPVSGDQSWGQLEVYYDEVYLGPVIDTQTHILRKFQVQVNRYDSPILACQVPRVFLRGASAPFAQDALTPAWEEYVGPARRDWQWVQLKIERA